MQTVQYNIRKKLRCYVNCIMTDSNTESSSSLILPLYADGYPGIMYQKSESGLYFHPKGKRLSELFLYGQTLEPASLQTQGPFSFVVVQLYPFASNYLLRIDPKVLNDECFDLLQLKVIQKEGFQKKLNLTNDLPTQIETMLDLMESLLSAYQMEKHDRIQKAIHLIIRNKGLMKISDIRDQVHLTERTLERNFQNQVGLTPKQFAKIIQFQSSLEKMNDQDFDRITDIAYDSGFADQSHFIRVFKSYTGLSPRQYLKQAF